MDSTIFGDILRNKDTYKKQLLNEQSRAEELMRLTSKKPSRQEMLDIDDEDSHYSTRKSSKMFQPKINLKEPSSESSSASARNDTRSAKTKIVKKAKNHVCLVCENEIS